MYWMVNGRGNLSKNAMRRKQQLLDWAGDSIKRRLVLRDFCQSILDKDVKLNQYSKAAISELAGSN